MKTPNSGRPGGYTLQQGGTTLDDVAYGYDSVGRFGGLTSGNHQIGYAYYSGTNILRETTHAVAGSGTPRIETRAVDLAGRTTGVVTTVPSANSRRIAASAGYLLNSRGLREKLTREDGTSWHYGYNHRSEVTSGVKKLANGSLAAGLQFGYQFDAIGNREWAKSGGNSSGNNPRTVNYTPNALNQYAEITTPGSFDVLVRSPDAVGVAVNGAPAAVTTQGNFHRAEATVPNTDGAWAALNITSPVGQNSIAGHRWLPPASVNPTHDDDGNLTNDGRWTNTWDAENRLVTQTTTALAAAAGVPRIQVANTYDWQSRRVQKKVSTSTNGTTWTPRSDERFLYDRWNQVATFEASGTNLTVKETNLWGLDLSGSLQGAGGVSGLLAVKRASPQATLYPAFDGNGNIIAWTATNGDTQQRIDYDPFGNMVSREGVSGFEAPAWGFATKYQDKETGLLYYGYRFYDPVTGRWPSRDPIEEEGGINLYSYVGNDSVNLIDILGLQELLKKILFVGKDQTDIEKTQTIDPRYSIPGAQRNIISASTLYLMMVKEAKSAGFEVRENATFDQAKRVWESKICAHIVFYMHGTPLGNLQEIEDGPIAKVTDIFNPQKGFSKKLDIACCHFDVAVNKTLIDYYNKAAGIKIAPVKATQIFNDPHFKNGAVLREEYQQALLRFFYNLKKELEKSEKK